MKYEVVIYDGNRRTNYEFPRTATLANVFKILHFNPVAGSVTVKSWKAGIVIPVNDNQINKLPLEIYPYVKVNSIPRITVTLVSEPPKPKKKAPDADNHE
jgi:hypothetical protein